jgi:hypothetical protein
VAPHVRLTQSGGVAGISMVAETDVDELPAPAAARVRTALAGLDFTPGRHARSGPGAPDRFQYDLEVTDRGRRALTAHEPDLTPELQAIVDVLLPLAHPE